MAIEAKYKKFRADFNAQRVRLQGVLRLFDLVGNEQNLLIALKTKGVPVSLLPGFAEYSTQAAIFNKGINTLLVAVQGIDAGRNTIAPSATKPGDFDIVTDRPTGEARGLGAALLIIIAAAAVGLAGLIALSKHLENKGRALDQAFIKTIAQAPPDVRRAIIPQLKALTKTRGGVMEKLESFAGKVGKAGISAGIAVLIFLFAASYVSRQ